MEFSIYRYDPDKDQKPYYQSFKFERKEVTGQMVLDALEYLKTLDSTLTFRRSCGGGVCGSDGMNINGVNGLACQTNLDELPSKVIIRPLPGMPVIRDLVVDQEQFFKQYRAINPYVVSEKKAPKEGEHIQSPEQRDQLDGLYECILCACCSSSCPSYWWNPEKFIGPAGLLAACRFILDSRDSRTEERLDQLMDLYQLYRCRSIMNCASVCPKGLNPSQAIAHIRGKINQKVLSNGS